MSSVSWYALRIELLRYVRTPLLPLLALAPPLAMALFIWLMTLNVSREPVALVVEDQGVGEERLLGIIVSDTDAYRLQVTTRDQAVALLRQLRVAAIITIPPGFSQAVVQHRGRVGLEINNIDSDFADDIRRSLDRSIGAYDGLALERDDDDDVPARPPVGAPSRMPMARPLAMSRPMPMPTVARELVVASPYLIAVEEHDLRVCDVSFVAYALTPVLIYLLVTMGMLGVVVLSGRDADSGMTRAWAVSPCSPLAAMLVRITVAAGIALAMAALCLLLTRVVQRHPFALPHPLLLVATVALTAFGAAVLGALVSRLPWSSRSLALGALVLSTALFLLGGAFCTIAALPPWLQQLSAFDPLRAAIESLRQSLLAPARDQAALGASLPLALWGWPLLGLVGWLLLPRART